MSDAKAEVEVEVEVAESALEMLQGAVAGAVFAGVVFPIAVVLSGTVVALTRSLR